MIDRKSMMAYKQKLQFLNHRYTKYELRLLALLSEKPAVLASGEIQVMGLLRDGLITNSCTLVSQDLVLTDASGQLVHSDSFVVSFAATLTDKGRKFIETWKSNSGNLLESLE